MIQTRDILIIALLSLFFTGVIYGVEKIFFPTYIDEESFLEPSLPDDFLEISDPEIDMISPEEIISTQSGTTISETGSTTLISPEILEEFKQKARDKKSQDAFLFSYIPQNFLGEAQEHQLHAETFLKHTSIISKIRDLSVEMYKNMGSVRGKMKKKTIKMFGVNEIPESEFLSVFIHEFAHYLDIYFFSPSGFGDNSFKFYDVSWESTTIIKSGQKKSDFVSGYAMTNKYEDFAESLTYYIFHNNDFALKAQESEKLQDKYDFFGKYLFFEGEFIGTDFSQNQKIQNYYWDITKIPTNINKFLQYIENPI